MSVPAASSDSPRLPGGSPPRRPRRCADPNGARGDQAGPGDAEQASAANAAHRLRSRSPAGPGLRMRAGPPPRRGRGGSARGPEGIAGGRASAQPRCAARSTPCRWRWRWNVIAATRCAGSGISGPSAPPCWRPASARRPMRCAARGSPVENLCRSRRTGGGPSPQGGQRPEASPIAEPHRRSDDMGRAPEGSKQSRAREGREPRSDDALRRWAALLSERAALKPITARCPLVRDQPEPGGGRLRSAAATLRSSSPSRNGFWTIRSSPTAPTSIRAAVGVAGDEQDRQARASACATSRATSAPFMPGMAKSSSSRSIAGVAVEQIERGAAAAGLDARA